MDAAFARDFAEAWARAWNDHDLEAILAHYAEEVVFHSPRVRIVTGEDLDAVAGKAALRAYWSRALAQAPTLRFVVEGVFASSDALTVVYANHRGQRVAETFVFDAEGKVRESVAAYAL